MIAVLIIVAVGFVALVVLLVSQSGGPRVTTIETRHDHKKDGNDA